ncbi:MAG: RecQ family zinc-binding domain-containing protein [Aulosira sp. DedQUE10]|nr:RecQ family zinc-binding domain-containing protein [Aulosira sp. DedQUE10]
MPTYLSHSEVEVNQSASVQAATLAQQRRQQFMRSRLEMMRNYAELRDCRREFLLNYFGEIEDNKCGFCDNCQAGITGEEDTVQPLPINSYVIHTNYGMRQVMRYEADKMVVLFEKFGYKTLAVELVQRLLKQVE